MTARPQTGTYGYYRAMRRLIRLAIGPIAVLAILDSVQAFRAADAAWPQFRGPAGAGILDTARLPLTWSKTTNVAWSAEVAGRGWSSPVAWKDQVFVTSAISAGAFKEPSTGIYGNEYVAELTAQGLSQAEVLKRVNARDIEDAGESGEIRYMVYAFDAATGRIRWQREAHKGVPVGGRHRKNTFASETPATDGQRLYVYFGNVGLFCYALDGSPLWTTRFEPQPMYLNFGTASSPVVHDGRVYVLHDNDGKSFVAAVDARTGKDVWRVNREMPAGRLASGWSTPFIWQHSARTELVVIGRQHAVGYSLDGVELWKLRGLTGQSTPSPVAAGGLLYLSTGSQGESNRPMFVVRPGATGDISLAAGETSNASIAWMHPARVGLHVVTARLSRPCVRRERQRRHGGLRRAHWQGDLQGARRRHRQHVLGVALGGRRQGLFSQRGRQHVRRASRGCLRRAGEERPRRDELRDARART